MTIENNARIGSTDVLVTAYAIGLGGNYEESVEYRSCYTYQFSLEGLISDASVECGIMFYDKYGKKCEVRTIKIEPVEY